MEDITGDGLQPSQSQLMNHNLEHDQTFDSQSEDDNEDSPSNEDLLETPENSQFRRTPLFSSSAHQETLGPEFSSPLSAQAQGYLHPSVLQQPSVSLDFHTIKTFLLLGGIGLSNAESIAGHLETYFKSKRTHITDLQARPLELFGESKEPISEVGWQEGNKSHALALFRVPRDDGPCSYLIHINDCRAHLHQERNGAHLDWSVSDLTHFKGLLKAAQHKLVLLKWPMEDLKKLSAPTSERYTLFFFQLLMAFKAGRK